MAKLSSSMFISLDGVVEIGEGEWHFPYFDGPMGEAVTRTHAAPRMLFGRVTYDSFAGAWPERERAGEDDAQMAKDLGDKRKYVLSRSPLEFTWRNSEQLTGDFLEAVAALKAEEGDIFLSGSPSVVRQLLEHGLLDELNLFVHPVLVGKGVRLLPDGPTTHLKLVSSETFPKGVQLMVFRPVQGAPDETAYEEVREHIAQD